MSEMVPEEKEHAGHEKLAGQRPCGWGMGEEVITEHSHLKNEKRVEYEEGLGGPESHQRHGEQQQRSTDVDADAALTQREWDAAGRPTPRDLLMANV